MTDKPKLKALKESADANKTSYQFTHPNPKLLESFGFTNQRRTANGTLVKGETSIHIETEEFTSLCPITGQPDYASLHITYSPKERCVESKSLKLYLMGYRQHGAFHESVVQKICADLVDLLDPISLTVFGDFKARGGIAFKPTASYHAPKENIGIVEG